MEQPDLPQALTLCKTRGLMIEAEFVSYILGHETLVAGGRSGWRSWWRHVFIAMFRNARSAAAYFRLPPNRVVELGAQVVL